jgi:hypothetical protein
VENGLFVLANGVSSFKWRDGSSFPDAIPSDGIMVETINDDGVRLMPGRRYVALIASLASVGAVFTFAVVGLYAKYKHVQRQLRWMEDSACDDNTYELELHTPAAVAADVLITVSNSYLLRAEVRKRAWGAARKLMASSNPHAPVMEESSIRGQGNSGKQHDSCTGSSSPERQRLRDTARHFLVQTTSGAADDATVLMGDIIQAANSHFDTPSSMTNARQPDGQGRRDTGSGVATKEAEVGYILTLIADMERNRPQLIAKLGTWISFNMFDVYEACPEQPLVLTAVTAVRSFGLVQTLHLDEHKLILFLKQVEDGYLDNPYHNNIHAADVLNRLVCILCTEGLFTDGSVASGCFLLSAILAAAVHDYGHPGMNNDCEVAFDTAVSRQYNEQAVLEMQSTFQTLELMRSDPRLDFMEYLSTRMRRSVMSRVIQLVLATDMKRHFAIISDFKSSVS